MCLDTALPRTKQIMAAACAICENVENTPGVASASRVAAPLLSINPQHMALMTGRKWAVGRKLRVSFMGGQSSVRQRVAAQASKWMNYAGIALEFVDDPAAEIRVAFRSGDGSWSYIGTDALQIAPGSPTMNFGWLTSGTADDEYARVVLHEFGHALGCIHEHQHPQAGIPWDREAVYRYYWQTNGWPRWMVDENVFDRLPASQTQFSAFDPASIMCYPVPNELTIGDYEIGWNLDLSPMDREFIATVYPKTQPAASEIAVNGPPVAGRIGKHQQVDVYSFTAANEATYTLETTGPTDVVVTLLGPDDDKRVVAEDDDSGEGRNARIVQSVKPGIYAVRVRHYWPRGKGNYQVAIRTDEAP
jgi:hypothetical protein